MRQKLHDIEARKIARQCRLRELKVTFDWLPVE